MIAVLMEVMVSFVRLNRFMSLASFCREMQFSTEKRGFVPIFLLRFLVDLYVCGMAHM